MSERNDISPATPTRRDVVVAGAATVAALALAAPADAAAHASDFNFLVGSWNVHHRQLRRRLANETRWVTFGGTARLHTILGGLGNFDENVIEKPARTYTGVTLRLYDPKDRTWRIYWADEHDTGPLGPPLVGRFTDGLGTFHADDTLDGKPIKVRFLWKPLQPGGPQWEQAFSADHGTTWETNWIMQFTRATA